MMNIVQLLPIALLYASPMKLIVLVDTMTTVARIPTCVLSKHEISMAIFVLFIVPKFVRMTKYFVRVLEVLINGCY